MLVCTITFLSAGLTQTEVCRYATHRYPNGPAVLDDAMEVLIQQLQDRTLTSEDTNTSQNLKNLAKARPFSVLLTRCANETLVDSLGDEAVGMVVSDSVSSSFFCLLVFCVCVCV